MEQLILSLMVKTPECVVTDPRKPIIMTINPTKPTIVISTMNFVRGKVSRGPRNKRTHTTTPMLNPHTAPSRDWVPGHQLPITQSTTRRPADPRHPRPKQPAREHYPTRSAPPAGNDRAHPSTQADRPTYPGPQSRPQPRARPSQPGGTHGPYAGHQLTRRPLGSQQQGPLNLHSWRQRPNSVLGIRTNKQPSHHVLCQ